jgi:ribose transport system permease protein
MERMRRLTGSDETGPSPKRLAVGLSELVAKNIFVVILIVIVLALSAMSPYFLTRENLVNVSRQAAYVGVIAVGMTVVILTGGIDLAVGSVLALTACIFAGSMVKSGWPSPLAALAALALGAFLGSVSGVSIAYLRVPAFVATLGMMGIARGLVMVYTERGAISGLPREWQFWGTGTLLGIPSAVVIWFVLVLVVWFVLARTTFGRHVYAIGGNAEATWLSGVNVRLTKVVPYIICGFCSAVSGILLTARLNSVTPLVGYGYELDAIAAVVLGGTNLFGGRGGVIGTVLGTLMMAVLRNGMGLLNVSVWWQEAVIGTLLIVAIAISIATVGKGRAS